MAKYFNQSDIDEFSDCVGLFAKDADNKHIGSINELTIIMRSLGFSPTAREIEAYFQKNQRDGIIDFATFLEVLYEHSQKEKCQQEILAAFKAHDKRGKGTVPSQELQHILLNFGEKLTRNEVERLFKEANLSSRGEVPYNDVINVLLTPLPDYVS